VEELIDTVGARELMFTIGRVWLQDLIQNGEAMFTGDV